MTAAIIIPARFASTRLPGKPLLTETGKPLIQHVYEKAARARAASRVIIATDDQRIFDAVTGFGGEVVMTATDHTSGTARVAEAAAKIDADIIVNLQGDEPEIDPEHIDFLIGIQKEFNPFASTLACPFPESARIGAGSPEDPAAVKAILGSKKRKGVFTARYFTRDICPWPRDENNGVISPSDYYLHIGVYAFSRLSLNAFARAPVGVLEQTERLEQLRILEMGEEIAIGLIDQAAPGIDTPEDYRLFVKRMGRGAA